MTTALAAFQRPTVRAKLEKSVGKVKSVAEMLDDVGQALGKLDKAHHFGEAIAKVLPWVADIGEAAGEALPIVKFVVKLLGKKLSQPDPEVLAYLACTIAYQQSIEQALLEVGPPSAEARLGEFERDMKAAYKALDSLSFGDLSLDAATEHAFVRQADGFLEIFAENAGYDDAQKRRLLNSIKGSYAGNLNRLLSHGNTKERFAPLRALLELDASERRVLDALSRHADLQQWLYSEAPTLGGEPFALKHVYVETDAGRLTWGQIRSARDAGETRSPVGRASLNPFEETSSPRTPVLQAIMDLIGDPEFNDAVVVQGVAGSGKSALTLRLCAELIKEGLRPIRVRMRDLRFDRHANEAIPEAVMLETAASIEVQRPKDLFHGGRIWDQRVHFRDAEICPFILILDGWDEISISTKEGFEHRLERLLEQVRSEYLGANRRHHVRVIVTGRPTNALDRSTFLRDATAILTLRSMTPGQVETLVDRLFRALRERPLVPGAGASSPIPGVEHFRKALDRYARDFEAAREREKKSQEKAPAADGGSMDVLGHPLLAQIAVRVMAQWGPDPEALLETPTTLYRSLVDLTCEKGGQVEQEPLDLRDRHRVRGLALRDLLRRTAVAMTVFGVESIQYEELEKRLSLEPGQLASRADDATSDRALSALLLSFYFKGGLTHLGCEFLHKTFREYLYAEALVEMLKDYGHDTEQGRGVDHPLPVRKPYWKEFVREDPRFRWTRRIAPALSSQWLSREVAAHVRELLTWEIDRASGKAPATRQGQTTIPLSLEGWERVRDGLADLWDWWGEGVHLRPQPVWDRNNLDLERSFADELVEEALPKALKPGKTPAPRRTVTADARLGDGLFHLTAIVHRQMALATGWASRAANAEGRWAGVILEAPANRPCQSSVASEGKRWVFFAPAAGQRSYLINYCARINADGWRPMGIFPFGAELTGLDLSGANCFGLVVNVRLGLANLRGASFISAYLGVADLTGVNGEDLWASSTTLDDTQLVRASLRRAFIARSSCRRASFAESDLRSARFQGCDLRGTILVGANLRGAVLEDCLLDNADFTGAIVEGMVVRDTDTSKAKLTAEQRAQIEAATGLAGPPRMPERAPP